MSGIDNLDKSPKIQDSSESPHLMVLPRTSDELTEVHVGMHQRGRRKEEGIDESSGGLRVCLGFSERVGDGVEEHRFWHILQDAGAV